MKKMVITKTGIKTGKKYVDKKKRLHEKKLNLKDKIDLPQK